MKISKFMAKGLLRSLTALALFVGVVLGGSAPSFAQTARTIKGKVVDEKGEPLTGASVLVVGTTVGAAADLDGNFSLNLPAGKTQLVVSFIGYTDQKVTAKNGMTITLQPDSKSLSEVVVTGMVATDKRLFTGASDKLKADNIKLDGVPDVSRGLEGRSAGVSVQNVSGTFGTAPKIRVRGATSVLGSSKPLWVVDGVIQEDMVEIGPDALSSGDAATLISSAIAGLNADDIESFQILKDGSATSIYGAKAMAGVIVITTKKGRKGTSSFSYTGEFTSRLVPSYREFNIMNSQQQMSVYAEMQKKGWLNFSDVYRANTSGVFGKMYHLMNTYDPATGQFALENSPAGQAAYLRAAEMRNTDWFDELFSPAIMQNHSVSMSTGTDKSQMYVSASAMLDPGWMMASNVRRYTGNFNGTFDLSKKLSLTVIGGLAYRQQRAPGTVSQELDAVNGAVSRDFDINPYSYALNTSRTLDPNEMYMRNYAPFNIKHELKNNYMDFDVLDLKSQAELKWKPIRGLTLAALGAVKYSASNQEHKITEQSNQAMAYRAMGDGETIRNNRFLYKDPDKPNTEPFSILPEGGFYNTSLYKMLSYDFRATATYNTEIADKHIVNTYAGIEFNAQDRTRNAFEGWGMQYDKSEVPFWDYLLFKRLKEKNNDYYGLNNTFGRSNAAFATATYSYRHRYTLTGTARYEGSNRLGRSMRARWLPTWNIAAAWNAHEEEAFRKYLGKHVSNLTLKASYSLTADSGPSSVRNSRVILGTGSPWRPTASATEVSIFISQPENEGLTYEKKHEFNFGVDLGLMNNRISITADAYKRDNFDLIGSINTMAGLRYGNVATMKSHGYELSISTKNIQTKDFSWTTDFIFGYNQTEITRLKTVNHMLSFVSGSGFAREGYPVRSLFSIPFTGLDDYGFPTFNMGGMVNRSNYGSINFQERVNLGYLKYEGATDPTIMGSLGNIFNFKNFRLNVFVTYSGGNKLRLDPIFEVSYDDVSAMQRDFNDRWVNSGDETKTNVPVLAARRDVNGNNSIDQLQLGYNAYNYSSARVADGGFVRMKEISLTYTLPQTLLKSKVINSASVKLQATNLFLIYSDPKLRGQDPEFFRSGGVSAPVPKQVTATLRLGF